MLQLAVTQQKDARVMKVASIIALVYLPASLVASLFSTELFALNSVVLDMRQGIGIFLTLLLTLTASTVLTAYLWLRREPRFTSVALRCSRSS
jgi:Mg2+ and Co2+ transporter CorA